MSKPGTIDCSHVFLLPACGVSYLRRRYLRRSLSLLAALFTVVFIFKVQHLISDMSDAHGIRSKLNFHWTLTEVVSSGPAPSEDREEDEKARIRFAELGVNLINPVQVEDGGADTGSFLANIQLFHVNQNISSSEDGVGGEFNGRDSKREPSRLSPEQARALNLTVASGHRAIVTPGEAPDIYLTVLVISRPSNVLMRQAIRKTWGLESRDVGVCVRFVVGREETWNEIVDREQKIHGDVVVVDEEDTYEYLPNKVFDGITWVLRQARRPRYVMKTDDDTFIGLFQLLRELQAGAINSTQILGAICSNAAVVRGAGDKWAVSHLDYPFPFYPTYAYGGGYVMSLSAASLLVDTRARTFDWIHLEDVYITGMLAKKAGLTHVNHPGFSYWSSPKATPCDFVKNKRITSVNHTEKEFYSMYTGIQELLISRNVDHCKTEKIQSPSSAT